MIFGFRHPHLASTSSGEFSGKRRGSCHRDSCNFLFWFLASLVVFRLVPCCGCCLSFFVVTALPPWQKGAVAGVKLFGVWLLRCQACRIASEEMDANDSGTISKEEFESTLQDERVQAYFNAMKLDARYEVAIILPPFRVRRCKSASQFLHRTRGSGVFVRAPGLRWVRRDQPRLSV